MIHKFTLGILLAAALPAFSQDNHNKPITEESELNDNQDRIVLEEPAVTVKEAMERRAAAEAEAMEELDAAKKAYEERLAAVDQHTTNNLELIARRAIADGNLSDAAEAWEEALGIDEENDAAKEFFRTIGRWDVIQKRLTKTPGDNRRIWRREGIGRHSFVLQADGTWKEFNENGRLHATWAEASRDEHVIELHRPDGAMARVHRGRYYYTSDGKNWRGGKKGRWD